MKKFLAALIFLAASGALLWIVWFKPAKPEEEEKKPETDVPVHVARITRATLHGYVTAYGTVEPEPTGAQPAASARIAPPVPGIITAVNSSEGRTVKRGDVLFELDSRSADAVAERAGHVVEFAGKSLARQQQLIEAGGTSQKLLQEAEAALAAARTQQALLRIPSPLTGTLTRLNARAGDAVDLAATLAEVIDLDRLMISAGVPAEDLSLLKVGQSAEVVLEEGATPIPGTVTFISPLMDAKTGTAAIRVSVAARSGLRPGQLVMVRIVSAEHKGCLAVPVESLIRNEDGGLVIALVQGEKATQQTVKVGLRDSRLVEVVADGLQEGMTVVTDGAYGLPKETRIHVLPAREDAPAEK